MLKLRQGKVVTTNDTLYELWFIPIGSTVAVKREGSGPWTHGTVTDHSHDKYTGWSYKIHIVKMGRIMTRTTRQVRLTPISSEQYLKDQKLKNYENSKYRDVIYRQYKQNIRPNILNIHNHKCAPTNQMQENICAVRENSHTWESQKQEPSKV